MKKSCAFVAAVALAASLPGVAHAATSVTFNPGSGVLPAGATVFENFDAFTPGDSLGTNALVFEASAANEAARPAFGEIGNFAAVLADGSFTTTFAPTNLFAFILGSLDTYNRLTLMFEDGTSQLYVGGQIINDLSFPSGDQISGATNGAVSYRVTSGPQLVGATFASSSNAFEFDNLATGAVPEPATWAMMLGGFGLLGFAARKRNRMVRLSA